MKSELKKIAEEFTKGLLQNRSNIDMCFLVSFPLEGYLRFLGYDSKLVEGEVNNGEKHHHYWIEVDGIVVDPTASQFKKPNGSRMPKIYVGKKPEWYYTYK